MEHITDALHYIQGPLNKKIMELNWSQTRKECTAILSLNGMLANPATSSLPVNTLVQRSIEVANELEKQLALKPTPIEPQGTPIASTLH